MKIVFIVFVAIIISCGNELNKVKEISAEKEGPEEITEEVLMIFTDMGRSKLKLESPIVHRFEEEEDMKLICPIGMKVTFYDSLENIESVLTSKYGMLFTQKQFLKVKDSVVFRNYKQEQLDTELLNIYFDKDSIYTDEFVKVSTENGVIFGKELVANSNFTKYELLNITDSHLNYNESDFSNEKSKQNK